METNKKTGRPKGPEKVYYRKYVLPTTVPDLEAVVKLRESGKAEFKGFILKPAALISTEGQKPVESKLGGPAGFVEKHEGLFGNLALSECRDQTKALLDDVDAKCKEIEDLNKRLARCAAASDDQKTHWWRTKYEALAAKVGLNDSDQTLG